jgi:Zn-dependent peptidase ImmA (M78 family)
VHGALWMEAAEVGVDHSLDPDANPRMEGRYHFTLAHEIGHWQLHRRRRLRKPDPLLPFAPGELAAPTYVCRSKTRSRAELQANYFASSLLMPEAMIRGTWENLYGDQPMTLEALRQQEQAILRSELFLRSWVPTDDEEYIRWLMESVARPLAAKFRVSLQAMQIRLEELGLLIKNAPALAV